MQPLIGSLVRRAFAVSLILLAVMIATIAVALAQDVSDPGLSVDAGALVTALMHAVQTGSWGAAGLLAFIGAVFVLRLGGKKMWPWLGTDEGGAWLLFATVLAGGFLPAALGGTPIIWSLFGKAFLAAAGLGGSWALGRRLLRPLVPLVGKIPKVGDILSRILGFVAGAPAA